MRKKAPSNCSLNIDRTNNDFYNTFASSFDHIPFKDILPNLLLQYTIGKDILEIGSGTGILAAWLSEQGLHVSCIEPAQELAAKVSEKNLTVYPTTIQNFQTDDRYDSVLAISSLIHVPKKDLPLQIQKIKQILKPRGLLFISLIEGSSEEFEDPTHTGKLRYFAKWSQSEINALFSSYFNLLEEHKIYNKKMNCTFFLRVYSLI